MYTPCYTSKKGNIVELDISHHAYLMLEKRWALLYDEPCPKDLNDFITKNFSYAKRVKKLNYKEKKRKKKYGGGTLYFRHNDFTFVVQGNTIVTIEISNKGKRHLNKIKD